MVARHCSLKLMGVNRERVMFACDWGPSNPLLQTLNKIKTERVIC